MTRVIVTGSRHLDCSAMALDVVRRLKARYGDDLTVVEGGCRGVDAAFLAACRKLRVAVESHPADWDAHGKSAGPKRNELMLRAGADLAVVVHPTLAESKGTKDMCRRLIAAGIPTWLVANVAEMRRLTAEDLL